MIKTSLRPAALAALLLALAAIPLYAQNPRRISLLLRWDHQFQFAGYYAADWLGYYEEAGLEVEIRPGLGPDLLPIPVVEEVAAGRADFGVGAADILFGRERGFDLAVVATVLQKSPVRFFALAGTRLESPADFVGRRVGRNLNDLVDVELLALLGSSGLSADLLRASPLAAGPGQLLSGEVEIAGGYAIAFPYELERRGLAYASLDPAAFGVDFIGDSLFASAALVRREPELVRRFRDASLKGWKYALEHPEDMIERIVARLPRLSPVSDLRGLNLFQARALRGFVLHPYVELGSISAARWQAMHERLAELGVLSRPFDPAMIHDPEALARLRLRYKDEILTILIVLALATAAIALSLNAVLRGLVKRRTSELEAAVKAKDEALAGKDLLMKEIHHRVKNNLALVSSLVSLQASRFEEPRLVEALETVQRRIDTVVLVHERLYKGESAVEVELAAYFRGICEGLVLAAGPAAPELLLELGPGRARAKEALSLGLILTELVSNALKHAFPPGRRGRLSVTFRALEGACLLEVADDGRGLAPGDESKEGSFGLLLVDSLSSQLGARLSRDRSGIGTRWLLSFACEGASARDPAPD